MKKISMVMAALVAVIMSACQGGAGIKMATISSEEAVMADSIKDPKLQNEIDTICYIQGLSVSEQVENQIFSERGFNIDSAYYHDVVRGIIDGCCVDGDSAKMAYLAGVSIGYELNMYMEKGLKTQLFGPEDSTSTISKSKFLVGVLTQMQDKPYAIPGTLSELENMAMQRMQEIYMQKMMEQQEKYKKENDDYIAKISKQSGVKSLGDGIYYKVLKQGDGVIPTVDQVVCVNYEGKTIDGNIFDSSYQRGMPVEFSPAEVIPGWTKALTNMPVGSKWEVYIPYDQAYGEGGAGPIKGYSALTFTIELLNIVEEAAE